MEQSNIHNDNLAIVAKLETGNQRLSLHIGLNTRDVLRIAGKSGPGLVNYHYIGSPKSTQQLAIDGATTLSRFMRNVSLEVNGQLQSTWNELTDQTLGGLKQTALQAPKQHLASITYFSKSSMGGLAHYGGYLEKICEILVIDPTELDYFDNQLPMSQLLRDAEAVHYLKERVQQGLIHTQEATNELYQFIRNSQLSNYGVEKFYRLLASALERKELTAESSKGLAIAKQPIVSLSDLEPPMRAGSWQKQDWCNFFLWIQQIHGTSQPDWKHWANKTGKAYTTIRTMYSRYQNNELD